MKLIFRRQEGTHQFLLFQKESGVLVSLPEHVISIILILLIIGWLFSPCSGREIWWWAGIWITASIGIFIDHRYRLPTWERP